MKFVHNMIRVYDLEKALEFWCGALGFSQIRRSDYDKERFSLIFLKNEHSDFVLELTYNWDRDHDYSNGDNFGHIAFTVENIYDLCQKLIDKGIIINRPPKDGRMAFIKSPNGISLEFLQEGERLEPKEPWLSMENTGTW